MNTRQICALVASMLALILILSACGSSMPFQQATATATALPAVQPGDENAIIVEGRLLPNQTINLAFSTSGLIKDLNIREGGEVSSGQVLASLQGAEQLEATIENAKLEVISAQQAIDLLNENYASTLADAQQKLAQAKIDLKKAQDDRTSMVYRRASDATLDGVKADLIMAQEELDKAQDFYDHHSDGDELVAAQALRNLSSAKLARDRAQYNLNYASDLPNKDEIDRADAKLRVAEANLKTTRENLDRLSAGPDSRDLSLAEARRQAAQANLQAAQAQSSNLDLKAPIDGKIVNLGVSQGEQVNPGQVIATLADFSQWVVETSDLTELNVAKIEPGQKATLRADAMPDQKLTGTVERISDGYLDKQGDVTYTVRLVLDQKEAWLRWGMTFSVQFDPSSMAQTPGQVVNQPEKTNTPSTKGTATATPAAKDDAAVNIKSAKAAVTSYFDALEKQDALSAAGLLSKYSLVAERTTREEVTSSLEALFGKGTRWSNLVIKESQALDISTILLHVSYQITIKDDQEGTDTASQQDEWWPVRLENGVWLVNWNNVIDYRGLDLTDQTVGGLTINPLQMNRYYNRMILVLFAQNRTNDPMVLGQANETLAVFTFGEKTVEAVAHQWIFQPMRTYPEIKIEVQGTLINYPEKVEIRKWKNIQVAPWYTFDLSSGE